VASKFETVARAIETVRPRVYLPSAGPPCFLDPMLMHLNFERMNVFLGRQSFSSSFERDWRILPHKRWN